MPQNIPQLDFKATQKKAKHATVESLKYMINDCKEAIKANPEAEKSQGYYQDEISVYTMELKARKIYI